MRNQCCPSALTAIEACVLCSSGRSPREALQIAQPQFHCGTPPPAAAPRTTTRNMDSSPGRPQFRAPIALAPNTKRHFGGGTPTTAAPIKGRRYKEQSTSVKCDTIATRLLAGCAGIHVDFHADRHFDDLGG